MQSILSNIPFHEDDFNFEAKAEAPENPYELLDLSDWSPEIDGQIDELMEKAQQQQGEGLMPPDNDESGSPEEMEGCGGGCDTCPPGCGSETESFDTSAPPIEEKPSEFDGVDEDGFAWE